MASPSKELNSKKIKVLVVDDSALMRKMISKMLEEDPEIKVVGQAKNGKEAADWVPALKPDVIVMDIQMPIMDGIEAIKRIMSSNPTPIVVFSALTNKGSELALTALEMGAVDVLAKPGGPISLNIYDVKQDLIAKVKAAAKALVSKASRRLKNSKTIVMMKGQALKFHPQALAVIAASTGGPSALADVLSSMPLDPTLAILIVQHMPPLFTKELANRLNSLSPYEIKEAENGEVVMGGCAYVAPGDYHMIIERSASGTLKIRLEKSPKVNFVRPSADVTLMSLSRAFHGPIVVAILTGMGKNGCHGAKIIKDLGGRVIAQDPSTCIVDGMPQAVISAGIADCILPPQLIGSKILEYIKGV